MIGQRGEDSKPPDDVRYVGASIKRRHLQKKSGVKPGDVANKRHIEAGRRRLEAYYRQKGFADARVTVGEAGGIVTYQVDEGR